MKDIGIDDYFRAPIPAPHSGDLNRLIVIYAMPLGPALEN
jgi:hypothetical protein